MRTIVGLLTCLATAACVDSSQVAIGDQTDTVSTMGDVAWGASLRVVDADLDYATACGDVASHPCPLIAHATRAEVTADAIVWRGFVGSDENGEPLSQWDEEHDGYSIDVTRGSDGSITLPSVGDDGGLRVGGVLAWDGARWSGTVEWELSAVAGYSYLDVTIDP